LCKLSGVARLLLLLLLHFTQSQARRLKVSANAAVEANFNVSFVCLFALAKLLVVVEVG